MLSQEIEKLHEKLDEREAERRKGNINSSSEDDMIANLAMTPGWEVLKLRMIRRIADLLEPIEYPIETPLDVRGAMEEARRGRIEELRKTLSDVESTKLAKQSEKIQEKQENNQEEEPVGESGI